MFTTSMTQGGGLFLGDGRWDVSTGTLLSTGTLFVVDRVVDRDVVDYVELLTRVTCALCSGPRSSKMIQCSQHHPVRYEKKSQRL